MTTEVEKAVAVLEARFNAHEASCTERMEEVRNTFIEVKSMNKATHAMVVTILITVAFGAVAMVISILLKKDGLA